MKEGYANLFHQLLGSQSLPVFSLFQGKFYNFLHKISHSFHESVLTWAPVQCEGSICYRSAVTAGRGFERPPPSRVLGTGRLQDCLGSLTAVASHPSLSLNTLRVSLSLMEWPRQTAKHLLFLLPQSLPPHTSPRSIPLNFTAPCGQINQWLHLSDFLSDCFPIWFSSSDPQYSCPNFFFSPLSQR